MTKRPFTTFDTHKLKNYFFTGLVILLPVTLTLIVVNFVFNLLTRPFEGVALSFLRSLGVFHGGFLFFSEEQLIIASAKLIILFFLVFSTVMVGYLARWFFMHWVIRLGDSILTRIPFIRTVYKTSQDVIKTLFQNSTKSFKQAVLVPYPNHKTYSIGLITKDGIEGLCEDHRFDTPIAVFVPTTPNPTSGFLLIFEKKDVILLDISIEEALKFIISCGVVATPLRTKNTPDENLE